MFSWRGCELQGSGGWPIKAKKYKTCSIKPSELYFANNHESFEENSVLPKDRNLMCILSYGTRTHKCALSKSTKCVANSCTKIDSIDYCQLELLIQMCSVILFTKYKQEYSLWNENLHFTLRIHTFFMWSLD